MNSVDNRESKVRQADLGERPDFGSFIFDGERTNSCLVLRIDGIDDSEIIIARERVQEFNSWLDR